MDQVERASCVTASLGAPRSPLLEQPLDVVGTAEGGHALQVVEQQGAVVHHVQVLHLERADAVLGREGRCDLLHRELVGVVAHVLGVVNIRAIVRRSPAYCNRFTTATRSPGT